MGNDCLMSIDGTNFRVLQTGTVIRGNAFASHKYAGKSALCYEIGDRGEYPRGGLRLDTRPLPRRHL
jgi:hypothetical protein